MRNNILFLHNHTEISGGEKSLLNLWKTLDPKNFQIFCLLPNAGPLGVEAEKYGVCTEILQIPQISVRNARAIYQSVRFLIRYIKTHKICLIHSYSPRNNILSAMAAKYCGIPVIWHERNLLFSIDGKTEIDRSRQWQIFADGIICNSNAVAQRFQSHTTKQIARTIHVIYNGANLREFCPKSKNDQLLSQFGINRNTPVVGFLGNLNARKRPDIFLRVAKEVRAAIPETKFLIIGSSFGNQEKDQRLSLEQLTRALDLESAVIFTGFQENPADYINLFDVLCHPTPKEACSRAIIESLACGKPVAAANDGGNPELIAHQQTGYLIQDISNTAAFAKPIIELLRNPLLRQKMGETARDVAQIRFDLKINTRETAHVYDTVLRHKEHRK